MTIRATAIDVRAEDGHQWQLIGRLPEQPRAALLWLPALGVAARHYEPFADALAAHGIAVLLHEWRGNGSSNLRASRQVDWGYRQILALDLPASQAALQATLPGVPLLLGGHSLGGQLACCHAGQQADRFAGLWLVATGTPWWRSFPAPLRYALALVYRFLPWLARRNGTLPGRRVGFGGNEARGLIADWARVGLGNRYAARGWDADLETGMARSQVPVQGIVMPRDWMAPLGSMQALVAKLAGRSTLQVLPAARPGRGEDHFSWMKNPAETARRLAGSLP